MIGGMSLLRLGMECIRARLLYREVLYRLCIICKRL
jgi:hypothetical protein